MKQIFLFLFFCSWLSSWAQDQIVFSSSRDGNSNLYLMSEDGSGLVQLTHSSLEEWAPTILNAQEITFLREEKAGIRRYKLNLQSKEETALPHPQSCILDDKNILYAPRSGKQLYQCDGNIYVAEADGSELRNVTENLEGKSWKASWFPSEERIAFTHRQAGVQDIYAIDISGENLSNLTQHPANDDAGDISPDGKKLLFSTDRDGNNNQEIYLMDLETREVENITQTPDWELIGRWSQDCQKVFIGSNRSGNWDIYLYDLSSKHTKQLTFSDSFDGDPRVLKSADR